MIIVKYAFYKFRRVRIAEVELRIPSTFYVMEILTGIS